MATAPQSQLGALLPIIEKIARDIAQAEIQKALNEDQYSVPTVADHHHNGTDSALLGPESLTPFTPAPATKGGVVNSTNLGNQVVAQGAVQVGYGNLRVGTDQQLTKGTFTLMPIPVVYGEGVGNDSAFNGGDAPVGSVVGFTNNGIPALSGIAFKSQFGWLYCAASQLI